MQFLTKIKVRIYPHVRNGKRCHFSFRKGLSRVLDPIHSNLLTKGKVMACAKISAVTARVKNTRLDKLSQVMSQVIQITQSRSIHEKNTKRM